MSGLCFIYKAQLRYRDGGTPMLFLNTLLKYPTSSKPHIRAVSDTEYIPEERSSQALAILRFSIYFDGDTPYTLQKMLLKYSGVIPHRRDSSETFGFSSV